LVNGSLLRFKALLDVCERRVKPAFFLLDLGQLALNKIPGQN